MAKKISCIITGLFILLAAYPVVAQQSDSCVPSEKVAMQLKAMDDTLSELRKDTKNICPKDMGGVTGEAKRLQSSLFQSYLSLLTLSVDYETFLYDFKRLVDADENHALAHDMELFQNKLEQFDALASQAANNCNAKKLDEIKSAKRGFYQEYRRLRKAENADSIYFQPDPETGIGYYQKGSTTSCNKEKFRWGELKKLVERLQQHWENLREASRKIQPREGKVVYNEFLQQQGLMPLEEAQKRLSGCGGQTPDNSYKTFFQQAGTCLAKPFINVAEQMSGAEKKAAEPPKDQTNEQYLQELQEQEAVAKKMKDHEERKNIFKPYLNRLARSTDDKLEETLLNTFMNLKGKDGLCDVTKKSADELVKFCNAIDTTTVGQCDNDKVNNTLSIQCD